MTRPKHTKPDINQKRIVAQLRDLGAVVWDTHDLATPVLDALVFWRGQIGVLEVKKDGWTIKDFTPGELDSIADLEAVGVKTIVASCIEDIVEAWEQ